MDNYYQQSRFYNPVDTRGQVSTKQALKAVKIKFDTLNKADKKLLIRIIRLFERNYYRPITRQVIASMLQKNRLSTSDIRLLTVFVDMRILQSYSIPNEATERGRGHRIEYRMSADNAYLFRLLLNAIQKQSTIQ